jgi:cytoskeleton protein RodZ
VGQFGDKFRKAREKKGISLDDASNVTKIGSRMLQAIEEENFDQLPGGVFNKGFIRAYAKHLGINDQEAVTEYLECLRQEQVKAQAVWQPQARTTPAPEKRSPAPEKRTVASANSVAVKTPAVVQHKPVVGEELPDLQLPKAEHVRPPRHKYLDRRETLPPWRLIAATIVVLVLAGVLWRRHTISNATPPVAAMTTPQSAANAPSSPAPAVPSAPSAVPANASAIPAPAPVNSSAQTAQNVGGAALPPAAKPTAAPASAAPDKTENDVTTRTLTATTKVSAETPAPALTLVIRATENSWVSVTADGQHVTSENLIAPAHTSVRASREIVARVGNAAGVTFLWNGQEIPAQGAEAEVKTFVFDAQGMRVVATSQPAPQTP